MEGAGSLEEGQLCPSHTLLKYLSPFLLFPFLRDPPVPSRPLPGKPALFSLLLCFPSSQLSFSLSGCLFLWARRTIFLEGN